MVRSNEISASDLILFFFFACSRSGCYRSALRLYCLFFKDLVLSLCSMFLVQVNIEGEE